MRKILNILILCCLYSFYGYGKSSFYIKVEDDKLKPTDNIYTKDAEFNKIISTYKIKNYRKLIPSTKHKWLSSIYSIDSETDMPIEVLKAFIGKGISLVEESEKEEEMQPTGVCENPNDKLSVQTNLDLIKIDSAWKYACGLPILDIAILDSCFNINQVDIAENVGGSEGLVYYTTRFHGTAVAGVASAVTNNGIGIAGTGMNAKMFLTTDGWATNTKVYSLAEAGYRVINCSWINKCSYSSITDSIYTVIRDTFNTVVVFGAGNGAKHCGSPSALVYPASYPAVLSVTSVAHKFERGHMDPVYGPADWKDCHEAIIGDLNQTHQHNSAVDICAPGYNVMTTFPDNTYKGSWGTSFAAPQVAAVVNLMASINPCLSAHDLIDMVKATADASIYDIPENASYIGLLGTGRLDANTAIKAAVESATIYINNALTVNTDMSKEANYSIKVNAPVTVTSGNELVLKARKDVTISNEFTVNSNAELTIDVDVSNTIDCNNN